MFPMSQHFFHADVNDLDSQQPNLEAKGNKDTRIKGHSTLWSFLQVTYVPGNDETPFRMF